MSSKGLLYDMDAFDHPPSYTRSSTDSRPSPSYSPVAGRSELVLQSPTLTGSGVSSSSSSAYVYQTKNLEINLGPRAWGTSLAAYGRNGIVEARVILSGDLKNVTGVNVALGGRVTNTFTERGLVSGAATVDILSASASASLRPLNTGQWETDHFISLPFPTYASGRHTILPPSNTSYQPGVTTEVKYWVKVTVVRKGLRRNNTLKVPILYLPRSFANGPLLSPIPDIVIDPYVPTLDTETDHVKVIRLNATWKKCPGYSPPVLSLPSTLSFAAYDAIPVNLTIVSPNAPAITKLLLCAVRIQLIKRMRSWVDGGRTVSTFNRVLGVANIVHTDETRVGVSVIVSELRSQELGTQTSWKVDKVAEVQYFIRVSVRPPASTADHIPSFEYEQPIDLTTDAFDSPEHEMLMQGYTPVPAIGLLQRSSSIDHTNSAVSSARSSYMGLVR